MFRVSSEYRDLGSLMVDCVFKSRTEGTPCENGCGFVLPRDFANRPPHRNCPAWKPQLGFVTARILTRIGITPHRYQTAKRIVSFGRWKTPCGCEARVNWLNHWIAPRWLTWLSGMTTKYYNAQASDTNEGTSKRDQSDLQSLPEVESPL